MIRLSLIGNPVSHSFSAQYFNQKFEVENIDAKYSLCQLESIEQLPGLLMQDRELIALNVTYPFKQEILKYIDYFTPSALESKAVNTVYVLRKNIGTNGRCADGMVLFGHNSDVVGFDTLLSSVLSCDNAPADSSGSVKALILGTGGAARAVAAALSQNKTEYRFVSRSHHENMLTYEVLSAEEIAGSTLIIDATPLGMGRYADRKPLLRYDAITSRHICIDLVYNPAVTPFMEECRRRGATVKNGMGMLVGQAEEAWKFWNNIHNIFYGNPISNFQK